MSDPDLTICYVIVPTLDGRYERMWAQSVASIRRFHPTIPVQLVYYGRAPTWLEILTNHWDVLLIAYSSYVRALASTLGHHSAATLQSYPPAAKILSLLAHPRCQNILFLDCDTFIMRDLSGLLAKYHDADFYASPEPYSAAYGAMRDLAHLDEMHYEILARGQQPVHIVQPFNSGVMLFQNWFCEILEQHHHMFFDYLLRLRNGALRSPSPKWLDEQVALWFALNHIIGPAALFDPHDVTLSGYAIDTPLDQMMLCHYFSGGEEQFFARQPRLALPLG